MRRAAFAGACVFAAAGGIAVGAADWLLRRAIRETPWGTCETGGYEHPLDGEHTIDLTVAYEAHAAPTRHNPASTGPLPGLRRPRVDRQRQRLALSWLALSLIALDIAATTGVRAETDPQEEARD